MESWKTPCRREQRSRQGCFNGATTMSRGRRGDPGRAAARSKLLQWGHDNGVVEDKMPTSSHDVESIASMGPRRWSRGRRDNADGELHDRAIASMGPRRWSRGRQPNGAAVRTAPAIASMGPRQWSRGRLLAGGRTCLRATDASMGPRRWSRGRRRHRRWLMSTKPSASMGPRQ